MNDQYTRRLSEIEAVLDKWLPEKPGSQWMEMVFDFSGNIVSPELALSLTLPPRDLVNRGGKRWRPLLMVLAAECIAGDSGARAALPLTPVVEFSHNASLIHDDIEDNSDERRGKPAIHLVYGVDTAINSGAFLYFLPLACVSRWEKDIGKAVSPELKEKIWTAWASHMRRLHLGQAMDIGWHRDFRSFPGLDEYDRMCRLKTGCLARLASVLGIYSASAALGRDIPGSFIDRFAASAEELGVGFQILDDVKNLTAGIPGKKPGDDIVEGKKSLPVLLYLHRYPEKRDFIASCFAAARIAGTDSPESAAMVNALESSGVLEEAREKAFLYIRKCKTSFSDMEIPGFPLNDEACRLLPGLIDLIS